jgi:hypothetical protein
MLKLICEHEINYNDLQVLVEQKNPNDRKVIKVVGPYIVAEKKNANGRVYDRSVMESAVSDFEENYIKMNRSVGELNHPDNTDINYENACHMITGLKQDGNIWVGESKVLTGVPKGDLLAGLLENEVKVGMSTRGVGNVTGDNRVDEYKLVAVDVVSNPSAPGAFVNGILECKNFMVDQHGEIVECAYQTLENKLKVLPKKSDAKKHLFANALSEFIRKI